MKTLLFLLTFAAITAEARLGETKAQLLARYGTPTKEEPDGRMSFKKNNVVIHVGVFRDECISITYLAAPAKFSNKQLDDLLLLNSPAVKAWKKPIDGPGGKDRFLTSVDGTIQAACFDGGDSLMIWNVEKAKLRDAENAAREDGAIKGF